MKILGERARAAFTLALAIAIGGCAAQTAANSPPSAPRVEDCSVVAISSPPKYACNGKVYTAFQLAKLRQDEAKKYESGK